MTDRPSPVLALLALAAVCGFGGSIAAQGTGASTDVLGALLVELRGLRVAMEQMASAGPRIQLALGRLQLQEQRVNNVLRRHTEVREQLASTEHAAAEVARRVEELQMALQNISDENERKGLQNMMAETKRQHGTLSVDLHRLRTEELEAAQLLAAEQARWTEINQRVEELERTLSR